MFQEKEAGYTTAAWKSVNGKKPLGWSMCGESLGGCSLEDGLGPGGMGLMYTMLKSLNFTSSGGHLRDPLGKQISQMCLSRDTSSRAEAEMRMSLQCY